MEKSRVHFLVDGAGLGTQTRQSSALIRILGHAQVYCFDSAFTDETLGIAKTLSSFENRIRQCSTKGRQKGTDTHTHTRTLLLPFAAHSTCPAAQTAS